MLHQLSTRLLHALTADRILLDLSPWAYTLFHVCVITVQAICTAYLVFMGRVYYFIDHPYMEYYADLLAPAENRHLKFFGTAFYVIAGLHGLHVLWILQPCAIYLVDCKHTGEDSPAPEVLDGLDELVLLNIYFMNCPQLQVPTSIQRFPNLIGVEVHNSTFAQWSVDAAIRAHLHPRMMYLIMVRVNMTGLPDGVLQPLPPLLTDIELIHTNLTALPDDLDERWPNMALLFFEYGQIYEFPPVLLKMPIYELSLIGNRIEELPSLKAEYNVLSMARNPVTKLPETIDKDAYVAFFSLHGAKVETLPRWVATHVKEELYLMGTPFCAALEDGQSDLQQWHGSSVVKCNEPDPRASGVSFGTR
ncbi:hypothetical protein Poli38472_001193 [Pythium oligandrum]|uniref:Uncharacterized protein n=1 Tax=Pythium oligandrum TaxID=41045 RepID=A0A8K1CSF8_PYTOL|nr:hypothetical protein Poli38472_001193 [Pythium oligandrum]|eukprot:TMW69037.1 hypothetical protein Poli38472_001193 [Pythium oligandrum]